MGCRIGPRQAWPSPLKTELGHSRRIFSLVATHCPSIRFDSVRTREPSPFGIVPQSGTIHLARSQRARLDDGGKQLIRQLHIPVREIDKMFP